VAARPLRSWVRIPPGAWTLVCCECYVLSGRGLCDELITRPEESYRLWCAVVCDLGTSRMRRQWPALGRSATEKKRQWSYEFHTFRPCCNYLITILHRLLKPEILNSTPTLRLLIVQQTQQVNITRTNVIGLTRASWYNSCPDTTVTRVRTKYDVHKWF